MDISPSHVTDSICLHSCNESWEMLQNTTLHIYQGSDFSSWVGVSQKLGLLGVLAYRLAASRDPHEVLQTSGDPHKVLQTSVEPHGVLQPSGDPHGVLWGLFHPSYEWNITTPSLNIHKHTWACTFHIILWCSYCGHFSLWFVSVLCVFLDS